ncbi:MAG: anti-sigma factor [Acidimicrobiales bacterium]
MAHDDSRLVAYLAGELAPVEAEAFETHLVACDGCWSAVSGDRRGRALAESLRELAPPVLRDRIRMAVEATPPAPRRPWRFRNRGVAAAVALLAIGLAAAGVGVIGRGPTDPETVAAVVRAAHDPAPPPTVRSAGRTLSLVRDSLDGRPVTVAVSDGPFPMPAAARLLGEGPGSPWATQRGPMTVVCLSEGQNLLVVAELPAERILSWARELPPIGTGGR